MRIIQFKDVFTLATDVQDQDATGNELQVTCEGTKFPLSELPNVQKQVLELLLKFVQDDDELALQKPKVKVTLTVTVEF